jgi:hypothetical protein
MNSSVILVSTLGTEGERFFVMPPPDERDLARTMLTLPKFASGVEAKAWAKERWHRYLQTRPALTEADAREALAEQGFDADDVEEKIAKARRAREWAPQHDIECLTQIGYRNGNGQMVVRKTDAAGSKPFQRVYVITCERCGHEYGIDGCDTHLCRCPMCQNGSPGIPY